MDKKKTQPYNEFRSGQPTRTKGDPSTEPFAARGDGIWIKRLEYANQDTTFTEKM